MAIETTDARAGTASVRRERARDLRRPSRPRPFGDLARLRNDPLGLFAEAAARGDDVVRFRAAHRSVFLVVGPEAIARVGIHNRANYLKGVSYDALRVPLPNALLTIDGDEARERRKLLMPMFTRRSLLGEVPSMIDAVRALFDRWDGYAASGAEFDLHSEMNRLTFDVVGRVLVGAELGDAMGRLESRLAHASDWVARRTRALVPLPNSVPTPRNVAYRRAYRELIGWIDQLVAARRAAASDGAAAQLVAAAGDGAMDDRQLRDEVAAFLMAGYQTTASALSWAWYLMARHEAVQDRFAAAAAIGLDTGEPDPERLEVIPYVRQVLDESMRLYPPGWAFTRTPIDDDEICGTHVPAGSVVILSSYANHHSPRLWDDPERFDPERFAPGRRELIPAYAYFPFGVGPHACIGKHMAEIEAKLALAMVAARYRVEAASAEPVGATPAITLTPAEPIRVRVTRR